LQFADGQLENFRRRTYGCSEFLFRPQISPRRDFPPRNFAASVAGGLCQGNLVGAEDGDEDSEVEMAPDDDHELNYDEQRLPPGGVVEQVRGTAVNSVFNERHLINADPVSSSVSGEVAVVQAIPPTATDFSVCRLSHSCTLLKPFDGFTCHSADRLGAPLINKMALIQHEGDMETPDSSTMRTIGNSTSLWGICSLIFTWVCQDNNNNKVHLGIY